MVGPPHYRHRSVKARLRIRHNLARITAISRAAAQAHPVRCHPRIPAIKHLSNGPAGIQPRSEASTEDHVERAHHGAGTADFRARRMAQPYSSLRLRSSQPERIQHAIGAAWHRAHPVTEVNTLHSAHQPGAQTTIAVIDQHWLATGHGMRYSPTYLRADIARSASRLSCFSRRV